MHKYDEDMGHGLDIDDFDQTEEVVTFKEKRERKDELDDEADDSGREEI